MSAGCVELRKRFHTSSEVETLIRGFESCALPREEWTHQAHLTVALWYLLRHPWPEAIRLVRAGIQRYNHAHGIITTKERGYHETITLFWMWIVRRYLATISPADCSLVALVGELLARHTDKNLPLEYYSRDLLMSWKARAEWVEPDLKSLD